MMKNQGNTKKFLRLRDISTTGRVKPWKVKHLRGISLADCYKRIGEGAQEEYRKRGVHMRYRLIKRFLAGAEGKLIEEMEAASMGLYDDEGRRVVNYGKRAKDVSFCGVDLTFKQESAESERLKLIKANFCRVPLCPMCQWRKSLRVLRDMSRIIREIEKREGAFEAIHVVLTVRNCEISELSGTLDVIYSGWNNLIDNLAKNRLKGLLKGWVRKLEIEYNEEENTFHPHFHALFIVDRKYFTSTKYLKTADLVRLWKQSANLEYYPCCWFKKVKKGIKDRGILEVAKYTYKDARLFSKNLSDGTKDYVIRAMADSIHGRRMYAYGGIMREIAKELKITDVEKANLVSLDDGEEKIIGGLADGVRRFRWWFGNVLDYIEVDGEGAPM